jgi:hypothetical protein
MKALLESKRVNSGLLVTALVAAFMERASQAGVDVDEETVRWVITTLIGGWMAIVASFSVRDPQEKGVLRMAVSGGAVTNNLGVNVGRKEALMDIVTWVAVALIMIALLMSGAGGPVDPPGPGPGPGPVDPPDPPDPPPDPGNPNDVFGLSKKSRDWARQVADRSRGKASALAANFEQISARITGGQITTIDAVKQQLTILNRATLPPGSEARADWEAWFYAFQSERGNIDIADLQDWRQVCDECAWGLSQIAGALV